MAEIDRSNLENARFGKTILCNMKDVITTNILIEINNNLNRIANVLENRIDVKVKNILVKNNTWHSKWIVVYY